MARCYGAFYPSDVRLAGGPGLGKVVEHSPKDEFPLHRGEYRLPDTRIEFPIQLVQHHLGVGVYIAFSVPLGILWGLLQAMERRHGSAEHVDERVEVRPCSV
jgi:hypothetical protein